MTREALSEGQAGEPIRVFHKDPSSRMNYFVNWAEDVNRPEDGNWLGDGNTIEASVWFIPEGITADEDTFTDTVTQVWLIDGTADEAYDLVNRVSTSDGRTDERTIRIYVLQR